MKIIITTSGLGQRLGDLTKYTNKSLVRVGNKFTICYIIEKYPKDSEFIITLGYYGKFVRDFLNIAYPNYSFTFVEIDNYDGDGSSLGYSLLKTSQILENKTYMYQATNILLTMCEKNILENSYPPSYPRKMNQTLEKPEQPGEITHDPLDVFIQLFLRIIYFSYI